MTTKTNKFYDPDAVNKMAKVRITTYVDADILSWLKSMAGRKKYQTLLNEILLEKMRNYYKKLSYEYELPVNSTSRGKGGKHD